MARLALILLACSLVVCHGQYLGGDNDKAGGADGEGEEKKEITDKYEILGVPGNADSKTIRKAYRGKIRHYHPDRLKNLSEEEKAAKKVEFDKISLAFRTLIDPEKRKRYDETGDDGTSKGDRAVDYSKNVDVEYMTYIWMVVLFLCGWYPLFILDDSHKKRRKKRIPKKNQPKESQLDIWAEYLYNLNQGQQTFLLAVGMLLFMYSGVAGGKMSKHERHYWTNMNEGITFLEREPVDYHQALEKFEAVLEEEYGQKKILPYLLYGQVKMELGDRGKCIEFLSKGFKKFPDPKKEELEDREGTEAFMVAAYRKIFDYDDENGLEGKDKFEEQALLLIKTAEKKYRKKDIYLLKQLEKLRNAILGAQAAKEGSGGGEEADEDDFDANKPDMSAMMDEDEEKEEAEDQAELTGTGGGGAAAEKKADEPKKWDKTGAGSVDVSDVEVDW